MYIHYIKLNNRGDGDFLIEKPHGITDYIYLVIKSPAILTIRTEVFTINTPIAVLIDTNTPHKYVSLGGDYEDDYYHFAVGDKKEFIDNLTFPFNVPVVLENYKSILETLAIIFDEFENQNLNTQSEQAVSLLTKYLLLKTGQEWLRANIKNDETPYYDKLSAVRNMILNNSQNHWTISELAEKANLSPAYFQVLYRRAFGSTCIKDIVDSRVSNAKELLISTGYSVNEISKLVGYNEVYHFIRQFKKSTGMTPGAFRKKV